MECPICKRGLKPTTKILIPVYDPKNLVQPIGYYTVKEGSRLHKLMKGK